MKRPPSRTGSQPAPKPKKVGRPKLVKPAKPPRSVKARPPKKATRGAAKRLSIHERNARATISRLKPKSSFGKRVWISLIAAVSVLVILVLVVWVTPVLAVTKIEVVGTNLVPKAKVLKELDYLKGRPLPQVTTEEVAERLSSYELIDSVSAVSVPPHTLRIVVIERTALAIVQVNGIDYLYDPAGIQLGRAKSGDRLPKILGAGNPSTSKAFSRSIEVILSLPGSLLDQVWSIQALSKDNVILKLRTNRQSILWGDASQPGLKGEVLQALMKHYKRSVGITFDVSSPNQPSVY